MQAPARPTSKQPLPEQCLTRKDNGDNGFEIQGGTLSFPPSASVYSGGEAVEANQSASTHCHHCTLKLRGDEDSHTVPTSFDAFSQEFVCRGRFCSVSCAKTAAQEQGGLCQALFSKWCAMTYGLDVSTVQAAPPRNALRRFGGTLSDEEFQELQVRQVRQVPFVHAYTTVTTTTTTGTTPAVHRKRVDEAPTAGANLERLYAKFLAERAQTEVNVVDQSSSLQSSQPSS